MELLDGKKVASFLEKELRGECQRIARSRKPCLATLLVGDDPASHIYVGRKLKMGKKLGIETRPYFLPANISQESLIKLITELNQEVAVDGILLQLPLPPQLDTMVLFNTIAPEKDVDGFGDSAAGKLFHETPSFIPCTPAGILYLLDYYNIEIEGAHCVILGRSYIVGKPLMLELIRKNATVTVLHSKSKNIDKFCQDADILISATGRAQSIPGKWIKKGAVVIDVGINRLPNGKLVGDVIFEEAKERARWLTPVPGGVGPLTIMMLMKNTLKAFFRRRDVPDLVERM